MSVKYPIQLRQLHEEGWFMDTLQDIQDEMKPIPAWDPENPNEEKWKADSHHREGVKWALMKLGVKI